MVWAVLAACSAPGWFALPDPSGGDPAGEDSHGEASSVPGVPDLGEVGRQVRHAMELRRALWRAEGRARWPARARAAEAYRAVRIYFPEHPDVAAEAAFRAGELWRGGGEHALALREFSAARRLTPLGVFGLRAGLEIGHLMRRQGDDEAALSAYFEVLANPQADERLRIEATLHAGDTNFKNGNAELARSLWERVVATAEDPLQRVAAFDSIALELIDRGDLEGAAGALDRCRRALSKPAREQTLRGSRLRNALARMRAVNALRDAIRHRREGVQIDGRATRARE